MEKFNGTLAKLPVALAVKSIVLNLFFSTITSVILFKFKVGAVVALAVVALAVVALAVVALAVVALAVVALAVVALALHHDTISNAPVNDKRTSA